MYSSVRSLGRPICDLRRCQQSVLAGVRVQGAGGRGRGSGFRVRRLDLMAREVVIRSCGRGARGIRCGIPEPRTLNPEP